MLIIPFSLVLNLANKIKIKKIRKELKQEGINFEVLYDDLENCNYWLIREIIGREFSGYSKSIFPGKYEPAFSEISIIKTVKSILISQPQSDLRWPGKLFYSFIVVFNLFLIVIWVAGYLLIKLG